MMSKTFRQQLDDVTELAESNGRRKAELAAADVTTFAYALLCDYGKNLERCGKNLERCDHPRFRLAENLWNSIRKTSPDLEIPPFLWKYQEDMDEARLEAQHIAEDHGGQGEAK